MMSFTEGFKGLATNPTELLSHLLLAIEIFRYHIV